MPHEKWFRTLDNKWLLAKKKIPFGKMIAYLLPKENMRATDCLSIT